MSAIVNCCFGCMILSIWAIIQLTLMGILYMCEVTILIEDAEAEEYDSNEEFIKLTKENYQAIAWNCWMVAGAYVLVLVLSVLGLSYGKKKARQLEALKNDDDYFCGTSANYGEERVRRKLYATTNK